jgi:hypothetical protein
MKNHANFCVYLKHNSLSIYGSDECFKQELSHKEKQITFYFKYTFSLS